MKAPNPPVGPARPAFPGATPAASHRVLLVAPGAIAGAGPNARAGMGAWLEAAGYQVEQIPSAEEVLARDPASLPRIILSARMLRAHSGPGLAGPDFCAALRSHMGQHYIYFLMLGGWVHEDEVSAALAAGVDDILPDPLPEAKLRLRLAAGERILAMANRLTETNQAMSRTLERLREAQKTQDRDMAEARRLQQGLVHDRFQRFGPMRVSLLLRPSGQIGGDMVGCFPIGRRRIGIYALDVAGHGVTAALTAARVSALPWGQLGRNLAISAAGREPGAVMSPVEVAHFLNRLMLEDRATESYFTMVYADLDITTGQGRLVQAGHPNPMLQSADGSVRMLGQGGLPIGLVEDASYDEVSFSLAPGDRLFLASDGLVEATSPHGDLLGDDGLRAAMCMNARLGGQAFLESLCWSVNRFTGGVQGDDISAVLIEHRADDGGGDADGGGGAQGGGDAGGHSPRSAPSEAQIAAIR